jgi:hypothetical protein
MSERRHIDNWFLETRALIERHGWFVQAVFDDAHVWAYTVGLSAGFNHPELIVANICCSSCACAILNSIGELVREGRHLDHGDLLADPAGEPVRLSNVDRGNFETGVFAAWSGYYRFFGPPYPEERALEIVLPGHKPALSVAVAATEEGFRPIADD